MARPKGKKEAPKRKRAKPRPKPEPQRAPKAAKRPRKIVQKPAKVIQKAAPKRVCAVCRRAKPREQFRGPQGGLLPSCADCRTQKALERERRAAERAAAKGAKKAVKKVPKKGAVGWVKEFIQKRSTTTKQRAAAKKSLGPKKTKVAKPKTKKPTRTEKLAAEVKKLRAAETKREKELKKTKADLAKTKAGLKKLKAQEERKKERKRKRAEKPPAEAETRQFKSKIGKTTHVSATEVDGEPQYIWKELEEKTEDKLVRTPKGKTRRWARLVVELSKESLLFPENYRRLRGKAVIRTNWHPAHELVGKAAFVMDNLQKSGAVVPRAKVVIVESNKKPPRKVF